MQMEKMTLVLCNFASPESARSVVRILMQEKIIACANIREPHFAIYPWDGKIQEESETAVLFKAALENRDKLLQRLRALHPYELPGLIEIPAECNTDYATWLKG